MSFARKRKTGLSWLMQFVFFAGAMGYFTIAQAFVIGANFTGSSIVESGFIPPDSMGAVGNDYFVELINGRYAVYDKISGVRVQESSLNTFWNNANAGFDGGFAFDPRVLYDAASERWFAVAVDNAGNANNLLVAVSNSDDPTAGWNGFKIDADSDDSHWADFPTLGIDADGLYVAANMFSISGGVTPTVNLLTLPKADLINGIISDLTLLENLNTSGTGFSVQPAVNLDDTADGALAAPLLSAFNNNSLQRTTLTGPVDAPMLDTVGGSIAIDNLGDPPGAAQPGAADIHTSNDRFSGNVILQNGELWSVQSVNVNGRSGLRWFRIDEATNAIVESGLIADPAMDFYYGSIAVNDFGDVVIGFSGSSETQFVSSYAAVGKTENGVTTFADPTLLKAGVASYERFDSRGRNRWGDYSATVIDPTDPFSFWTIQEWASDEDQWSTQITQIIVDPTAVSIPGSLGLLGLGWMLLLSQRAGCRRWRVLCR